MRYRRSLAAAVLPLLVLAACNDSGRGSDDPVADPASDSADESLSIMYVQHALLGTSQPEQNGVRLTLGGVDQVTTWASDTTAGAMSTGELVERWDEFGMEDEPPQAALISTADEGGQVVVELSDPAWDEGARSLTYLARIAPDPDPLLADLAGSNSTIPVSFEALTVLIHQEEAPYDPSTPTTTTTTTSTTVAPATTAGPAVTTPTQSSTLPPTGPPQTPPTSSAPPPTGPSLFVVDRTELNFPVNGGIATLRLSNVGSGLGSWSAKAQTGTGMSVNPSSGFLFPGSSVMIQVAYNGAGPANDFATQVDILTASGPITISLRVG